MGKFTVKFHYTTCLAEQRYVVDLAVSTHSDHVRRYFPSNFIGKITNFFQKFREINLCNPRDFKSSIGHFLQFQGLRMPIMCNLTQILREINFGDSRSAKSAILVYTFRCSEL